MGGGGSDFRADEELAGAVDSLVRVSRMFLCPMGVPLEQARIEESGVGVQIDYLLVDLGRIRQVSIRCFVDYDGQASLAGVDLVDEEVLESSAAAHFRETDVAD
jgi:hypothetical protein